MPLTVRPATSADARWVNAVLTASWGEPTAVAHGTRYDLTALPTLIAEDDITREGIPEEDNTDEDSADEDSAKELLGVLTYHVENAALEVVSIDATVQRRGVGTALLAAAADEAHRLGCRRLWLITTNDNLDALRFYQRRGMRIVGISPGAIAASRQIKPAIPLVGAYGIPLHDELTLERRL